MNVVTASDDGFFHCLKELACSVKKYYDKPIIVYDLGLSEEHKKQFEAVIIPIQIDETVDHKGTSLLSPGGIPSTRATHKPFCVKHYFQYYTEPMIFVDADCLFTQKVEETGFDVGVTYTPPRKGKRVYYYNGVINSGVIFFNTPACELVDCWARQCRRKDTTDQKALSDVIEETVVLRDYKRIQQWHGLKIKIFDTAAYNDFHLTGKGKILHFINTKHDKDIYERLIAGYKKGKDIRAMFREIKRGRKSRPKIIKEKFIAFFQKLGTGN
ncbi:MAG: hypothetical protein ABIG61_10310 [Planctomycetota bacterium]